ncbi:T9SS type A sorting domain-containing protein [bacterium]|nr:T9SS type A sorting domain-containing protein [bacterium]
MKRYAVACATLVLLTLICFAGSAQAAWLALPEAESQTAQFDVLESTPTQTVLNWSAGSLELAEGDEGLMQANIAGVKADRHVEGAPEFTRLVRLPWGRSGNLQVVGGVVSHVSADGALLGTVGLDESPINPVDWVSMGDAGVMRDVTLAPLHMTPVKFDEDGSAWVAASLQLVVETNDRLEDVSNQEPTRPVSRAFWPIYQEMITDDLDDLGTRLATTKGTYLIIAHTTYVNNLQPFIQWKEQKGYTVELHETTSSISFAQLQNLVADRYENSDPALEFVLLVGDVNRGADAAIPSSLIQNPDERYSEEWDVTDWEYANIEGGDYFPEVFIGRMTAGSPTDVFRIVQRTLAYEKNSVNIPLDDPYFETVHLVAANYSEGGAQPLTPVATSEWLGERMRHTWQIPNVLEYFVYQSGQGPNGEDIKSGINQFGGLFVTYRGWGNAQGWEVPLFTISDISDLTNVFRLPVLTSFVCNTGDFGNASNPESFGEKWLVGGTPTNPTGAVAVVAPSDLHTQTAYNNSLIAGYYTGVYAEYMGNISQALLRAKIELYNNFPLNRADGDKVEFYWHVYHVLGDPELSMWRRPPRLMEVTLPEEITFGQDFLEVSVQGMNGALPNTYVQLIQGETLSSGGYTDASGIAYIPMEDLDLESDVQVTLTHQDYLPVIETLSVTQAPRFIGVASWDVDAGADGLVNPDESVEVVVTLTNSGTEAVNGINATISTQNSDLVEITSSSASYGDLGSGASADNATSAFTFTLNGSAPDGAMIELDVTITDNADREWTGKVWIPVGTSNMNFVSATSTSGSFEPGSSPSMEFSFENIGSVSADNLTATLLSWDEAVTVTDGEVTGVNIASGATGAVGNFTVNVNSSTYHGRVVRFSMVFTKDGTEVDRLNFSVPLEGATTTDPFGPDSHGYFIYDDTDTQWDEAPTYTAFNIAEDDNSTLYELHDDDNVSVELPFDFMFYGRAYDEGSPLTVSSNGWISFKEESDYTVNFFRNWGIPSSLGPTGMIAAFWDDLKPPFGSTTMSVYTRYDQGEGRFIIEWHDALNRFLYDQNVSNPAQFTVVLYDPSVMQTQSGDGVIEIYYDNVVNVDESNNYATVGLMNRLRNVGLEYTYANLYPASAAALENERVLRMTTNAPDNLNDVGERADDPTSPNDFVLYQSYPNPFNSATEIAFDLPESGDVRLSVYNLLGQEIAVLIDRPMSAGHKQVTWQVNDKSLSSGLLLVRLDAGNKILWSKMMYVK